MAYRDETNVSFIVKFSLLNLGETSRNSLSLWVLNLINNIHSSERMITESKLFL